VLLEKGCPPGSCTVTADRRPDDIRDYTQVRDIPLLLGAIPATLLLASAIAAGPGWAGARIRPALTLRSE
jgi:hypothetical protein